MTTATELRQRGMTLQQELSQLLAQVNQIDVDVDEHALVLETLADVVARDVDRRCFRLIGGILTERTAADGHAQVEANLQGLKAVQKNLHAAYAAKQKAYTEWIAEAKKHDEGVEREQADGGAD